MQTWEDGEKPGIEKGTMLQRRNEPRVNCGKERDGVVVHIEVGGLIMGGMEECTEGMREGGKERGRGGGHLPLRRLRRGKKKNISLGSAN